MEAPRDGPPQEATLRDLARRGVREGRARYGDLGDEAGLLARVRRGGRAGQDLALADLYLVAACERDVPGAWETLARTLRPVLARVSRHRGASGTEADEAVAEVLAHLALPGKDGARGLSSYSGRGSLINWSSVLVLRRLVDGRRRASPSPATLDPASLPDGQGRADDPGRTAEERELCDSAVGALREAWGQLTAREALTLALRFRDGLTQRRIAALLGVGEPQVSRTVSGATAKLRRAMEVRMGTDLSAARSDHSQALANLLSDQLQDRGPANDHDDQGDPSHV